MGEIIEDQPGPGEEGLDQEFGETVHFTKGSVELMGVARGKEATGAKRPFDPWDLVQDEPLLMHALEDRDHLIAERDRGLMVCSQCGQRVKRGAGFVTSGRARYCEPCAQLRRMIRQ